MDIQPSHHAPAGEGPAPSPETLADDLLVLCLDGMRLQRGSLDNAYVDDVAGRTGLAGLLARARDAAAAQG